MKMNLINLKNYFYKIYIYILFYFQIIKIVHSSPIDKIIFLGDSFRYNHFSFNSNGDMIVDTHNFPIDNKRLFFGLKKMVNFISKILIIKGLLII